MRVEITDSTGYRHMIDSTDYKLIGQWFAEKAAVFASANTQYNHPVSLDVWPSGPTYEQDTEVMRQLELKKPVTAVDLLELVRGLLVLSEVWPNELPLTETQ